MEIRLVRIAAIGVAAVLKKLPHDQNELFGLSSHLGCSIQVGRRIKLGAANVQRWPFSFAAILRCSESIRPIRIQLLEIFAISLTARP